MMDKLAKTESSFATELAEILGRDSYVVKTAGVKLPVVPEEAIIKKASDMGMDEILDNENFRQGVADEIAVQIELYGPTLTARLFGEEE